MVGKGKSAQSRSAPEAHAINMFYSLNDYFDSSRRIYAAHEFPLQIQ